MRTSDMIKSKFFRAADVQGRPPLVLTIAGVTEELVQKDMRTFLWFSEHLKGLRINKTNVRVLEAAYGPESDLWTGRRVRLSFDPTVEFGGRAVGGIKLETPPGVIYAGPPASPWGAAAAPGPTAPPTPVWDPASNSWRLPAPIAAPAAPAAPPQPVWDAAGNRWVLPAAGPAPAPPDPQAATWGGAPTISQRMAQGPRPDEFGDPGAGSVQPALPGEDPEFGHADIPF